MKTTVQSFKACAQSTFAAFFLGSRLRLYAVAVLAFFTITPGVWTQVPPSGVMVGLTPTASMRNAAIATRSQAAAAASTARTWAAQASSAYYRADQVGPDFATTRLQFQALRERFNWLAALALQANRPYANNVLAELDAGLNIISELWLFLDQQFAAGIFDRATIVRTCRTFEEAMRQWEYELRRGCSRMGIAS